MEANVAVFTLTIILSVVTLVGNGIIISMFVAFKDIRITRNYIILSLALADMLVGVFAIPLEAHQSYLKQWPFTNLLCYSRIISDIILTVVSLQAVSLMAAMDTWLVYRTASTNMNKVYSFRNVSLLVVVSWVVPVGTLLIPMAFNPNFVQLILSYGLDSKHIFVDAVHCLKYFPEQIFTGFVVTYYLLGVASMVCCYVAIYLKIRDRTGSRSNFIRPIHRTSTNPTDPTTISPTLAARKFKRNKSYIKMTFAMAVLASVCYLPAAILFVMESLSPIQIPPSALKSVLWIAYLKSTLNPLICGLFNTKYRERFKTMFRSNLNNHPRVDSNGLVFQDDDNI